ncbi:hypothetical protein KIPB_004300 [Kipferlia bialata]|uniref:Uncharacterized protein n=1 Tax=Kipferlia bialata TaxID=797122 RepID=A0A9K3GHN8_9EUKA|nr:hypothetical protein KIPB_004300 [Kipferlia bialata]|eukprot:g4300.t1
MSGRSSPTEAPCVHEQLAYLKQTVTIQSRQCQRRKYTKADYKQAMVPHMHPQTMAVLKGMYESACKSGKMPYNTNLWEELKNSGPELGALPRSVAKEALESAVHLFLGLRLYWGSQLLSEEDFLLYELARFGGTPTLQKHRMPWLAKAKIGDVERDTPPMQDLHLPQPGRVSFGTTVEQSMPLDMGTTHVAIGAVDLAPLLMAYIHPKEGEHTDPIPVEERRNKDFPLKYIGYHTCPYAISKSKVIWELIKTTDEAICAQTVLQILAEKKTSSRGDTDPVLAILGHWGSATESRVSASGAAYGHCLNHKVGDCDNACHPVFLAQEVDRNAVSTLNLTGVFAVPSDLPEGTGLVGSPAYFDIPDLDRIRLVQPGECPLRVASVKDMVAHTHREEGESIVDGLVRFLSERVNQLRYLAKYGKVTCELHCDDVEAIGPQIKELRAATMSWANTMDMYPPNMFHALVDTCDYRKRPQYAWQRTTPTVHFGYSTRWHCSVKGTWVTDYSCQDRQGVLDESIVYTTQRWKTEGIDSVLQAPPPVECTMLMLGERHRHTWTEWFQESSYGGKAEHTSESIIYRLGSESDAESRPLSVTLPQGHDLHLSWVYGKKGAMDRIIEETERRMKGEPAPEGPVNWSQQDG